MLEGRGRKHDDLAGIWSKGGGGPPQGLSSIEGEGRGVESGNWGGWRGEEAEGDMGWEAMVRTLEASWGVAPGTASSVETGG